MRSPSVPFRWAASVVAAAASTVLTVTAMALAPACKLQKPPTPVPAAARSRLIVQKQFRLGTFDFGGNVDERFDPLAEALPGMLLTEIRREGRFSVYEGGNIRSHWPTGEALNEANAAEHVDGYLSGTIIKHSETEVCFDVRLANAVNHEVLYAAQACTPLVAGPAPATAAARAVPVEAAAAALAAPVETAAAGATRSAGTTAPAREGILRVAKDLSRAIKRVGFGKVISVDGPLVFVDKGGDADVMPGMVAFVVATGDSVLDPAVHTAVKSFTGVAPAALGLAATPVVVGEMYVVSVEEAYSVGRLYRGDFALPGDTVFFK